MAQIAIYIGRHLCTAPRAINEADALASAGHEVTVHGCWWDPQLVARDRDLMSNRSWHLAPFLDARPGSLVRSWRWWQSRLRSRWDTELYRRANLNYPGVLGYGVNHLLAHARQSSANLIIAHAEGSLWAIQQLRKDGRCTGIDFEDWFSRDLTEIQRRRRPTSWLATLEASALKHCAYITTTSRAMAEAMQAEHGGAIPSVIYNTSVYTPLNHDNVDFSNRPVKLHWFSQTIGPARGLETLVAALQLVRGYWSLDLRGDDPKGYGEQLRQGFPPALRDRVTLLPTVPASELSRSTSAFDIGLSLEVSTIQSRNLTITNKVFQYLHSGLAVIASDTAGNREVLKEAPACGILCDAANPTELANALDYYLLAPERLKTAREASLCAARTTFDHGRQKAVYAKLAAAALET